MNRRKLAKNMKTHFIDVLAGFSYNGLIKIYKNYNYFIINKI